VPDEPDRIYFRRLVHETTTVLDILSRAVPQPEVMAEAATTIARTARSLAALPVLPEELDVPAHAPGNPRFQPHERGLVPEVFIDVDEDVRIVGRVRFGQRFGGTAAVHGGAITLLFDDLLGRLGNRGLIDRVARTAYLHVDFRQLTPLDTELVCSAWLQRREGRKLLLRGALEHAGVVLAEAEGLWVLPRDRTGDG
jgi:hypothetical protein